MKSPLSNFMEIYTLEAALVHVGIWMDLTKLTGTFVTKQMCLKGLT